MQTQKQTKTTTFRHSEADHNFFYFCFKKAGAAWKQ